VGEPGRVVAGAKSRCGGNFAMSGDGAGEPGRVVSGAKSRCGENFAMSEGGTGEPGEGLVSKINFGGSRNCLSGDEAEVGKTSPKKSPSPEFGLGADWNGGNWSTKNK
jgi:hypothetical protein